MARSPIMNSTPSPDSWLRVVVAAGGRMLSVMGFTVAHGKIVAIDVLYDPKRLTDLDLAVLDG